MAPEAVPTNIAPPPDSAASFSPAVDSPAIQRTESPPTQPAQPASGPQPTGSSPPVVQVRITLVEGGITNLQVKVAVAGRYDGLPLGGGARAFDRKLDSWLTRALELGMIGSGLGQLYPLNLEKRREEGSGQPPERRINTSYLLLASMGEPGRFAQDGLRYLISNIVVATKGLAYDEFATGLLGTRRNELAITDAIRALLQGIHDGYERFHAIAETVTDDRAQFVEAAGRPLDILLVDKDATKLDRMAEAVEAVMAQNILSGLKVEMRPRRTVEQDDPHPAPRAPDTDADLPVTLLRITRAKPVERVARTEATPPPTTSADQAQVPAASEQLQTQVLEFSALSDVAAVPVREMEVNKYWLRELPPRMIRAKKREEQARLSAFFSNCLFPEEFRKHIQTAKNLIFEVDEFTAPFPWEMAAHQAFSRTTFLSTNIGVSRQFRSLLSPPPTAVPPLNTTLKVLVIADPAPGELSLPGARREGAAVVKILDEACKAWAGRYKFEATVRIGSKKEGDTNPELASAKDAQCIVVDAKPCEPLDLAMLIVDEHFDVIHYAGHGFCDSSRQAGWVLAPDCFLTAKEIFRVRQVPRLVFANACFSAVTTADGETGIDAHREKSVGLAQAFFARGIPNYIGAGWPVGDAAAFQCARWFYAGVLGLNGLEASSGVNPTAPPATIGEALRNAREQTLGIEPTTMGAGREQFDPATWGAYQHYGRVGDKLLPFVNVPGAEGAE